MIQRRLFSQLRDRLRRFPAVVLSGPRRVGKTTLALALASEMDAVYLDLESEADRTKLADPALYLRTHARRLVILDEVHRLPDLFAALRNLIDEEPAPGRFLLLASTDLSSIPRAGEALGGLMSRLELAPLDMLETELALETLWLRGGFPESVLAADDAQSLLWRRNFLSIYLERDIPQLGSRISAATLRRFWTMLAHAQGGLFNAAQLSRGLGVTGKTVANYLDMFSALMLVRRLPAWRGNVGKRLVKSPKVYVRDSGLAHALLGIHHFETLMGHPAVGPSWEGFLVENCLAVAPAGVNACFYRTAAGAEIDLLLEMPGGECWAVAIRLGLTPRLEKGFQMARADLKPTRSFVITSGRGRYSLGEGVEAVGIVEMLELLSRGE